MLRVVSLGIAVVFAGVIGASSTAEQVGSVPATCELHIWPTDKFVVTENLGGASLGLVGALVDEATRLKSPEGVKEQLTTQLNLSAQEKIIRDLNLNVVLNIPNYKVVVKPADSQPLWTLAQMNSIDRLSKNAPICYAELAVISNQYFKQAICTRLRTFVRYREFNADGKLHVKVLDATATKAKDFPAKNNDGITTSAASLQNAFRDNLIKVAKDNVRR